MAELLGLSEAEVKSRRLKGLDNSYKIDSSKSTWEIVRGNTFSLFNAVNASIAIALIAVGSYRNALFILFIVFNTVVGIIVELRARSIVDKLTILNKEPVTVIRDGKEVLITPDEIVFGDLLKLATGDQVPSDAIVKQGMIEANEALLTGESDLIAKRINAHLLSGSFVASGECIAEVEHVGAENYSTKLAIEAKVHKPINSQLLKAMRTVSRFTSRIVVPMGIILLIESLVIKGVGTQEAVVSSASAVLGMLPKGMMVLIVLSLILALIKLGQKKVLVQEMYSIETMAYVDTLCLDKTGTITEGKMKVRDFKILGFHSKRKFLKLMGSYLHYNDDNSSTMQALVNYFNSNEHYEGSRNVPFSSERKWGAAYFDRIGTLILGAPDKLLNEVPEEIALAQAKGRRVLLFGMTKHNLALGSQPEDVQPIAMIELEDPIRKNAKKTLQYLKRQKVDLKIISGDNPETVSAIAKKIGFKNYKDFVNASKLSDAQLKKLAIDTAIFGRVSPRQKRLIVQHLRENGRTVAMTGDGVNDILALREADLSIAMAAGDAATKQIASLVLIDSDFTDLPNVLFEARRVVNNMFRIGSIFFVKTIYSFFLVILSALSIFTGNIAVFPFIAIQITLIDQTIEGWPSFWMSFENDRTPVKGNFLGVSLFKALPSAILIAASVTFLHFYGAAEGWDTKDIVTVMFYILGAITTFNVVKACFPLNKLRAFLIVTTIGGFLGASVILRDFVEINLLSSKTMPVFIVLLLACIIIRILWDLIFERKKKAKA
ncbi:HAD-IC family P-type ATPase [Candidatus Saccharibacteria bacterium]|nr:HAD-IC family P-type ATPase [Candidatus Saccharibacteria bacterium]